ncbi:MAG: peptidoglycan-binding protein [Kiloniellales bacterium]
MLRLGSLVVALALTLGACGNTAEDRGITGAGLGAAGGAILGAVTGLSVLEGALIGTGIGGITGLLTDKDDLDIGDPIWERWFGGGSSSHASRADAAGSSQVAETQRELVRLGYDPGPVDGIMGPRTNAAMRQYEQDYGRSID